MTIEQQTAKQQTTEQQTTAGDAEHLGAEYPTTEADFLTASLATVAAVAPHSMIYAPGGTRRSAAFTGIRPGSAHYLRWIVEQMVPCVATIFRHQVNHLFMPLIMAGHLQEAKQDVEKEVLRPAFQLVTDPFLLQTCREQGWRIKLAPSAYDDLLQPVIESLEANTPQDAPHTWWFSITPSHDSWWDRLLVLAKQAHVQTRRDAIRALYGEEIPPITLCLGFGKPMLSPDLCPPLLMDTVQCYWSQQAGYSLTDRQFRKVLYDYAYQRRTWRQDKAERAAEAKPHQAVWQQEVVLGLGKRLGPFWYPELTQPEPVSTPSTTDQTAEQTITQAIAQTTR